ncbi:MAG: riboflavin synthase [Myxococcales bacterium]|nr:riboflavin synthase [Myxococcales bacterium]MCB9708609.1 riboflavin synthase [Myxococcales bacterium]
MFTGIVQTLGIVQSLTPSQDGLVLRIRADYEDLAVGESVAVDGVCLSVTPEKDGTFSAHASKRTLADTTFGELNPNHTVHLERAALPSTRLGGHIVTGHVDGLSTLVERTEEGDCLVARFSAPPQLMRYIASKGSVALNGVSLTVNGLSDLAFDVTLIPLTLHGTCFGAYSIGTHVNLEVDLVSKYVVRFLETSPSYVA